VALTLCGPAFQRVHLTSGLVTLLTRSFNPAVQARRFGLFRFRSPLLSESLLIYFPPGTEMVHFPGLTRTRLCIQRAVIPVYGIGFPHSDIPGSKPACDSPRLFAACHVLHRLLAPRHPPYALSSLTIKLTQHVANSRVPALPERRISPPRKIRCRETNVEQVRLSTNCSARAEFADYAPYRSVLVNASSRCAMPAYSVVKELCLRLTRTAPLPAGRSLPFTQRIEAIKNPASSAGPNRPHIAGRVRAKLD
jgi:hypothetical protein